MIVLLRPSRLLLVAALVAAATSISARAIAAPIFEPNNAPNKATILNAGTLVVNDSLSANVGRPDTLLGHTSDNYTNYDLVDDNSSSLGNGFASQLLQVPMNANGSAYFKVTGAGDVFFDKSHQQFGEYTYQFKLYNSAHQLIETRPVLVEDVLKGKMDNIWINPNPAYVGGFVDAIINNISGPGNGDSLDFFQFNGLLPNQDFTARITSSQFAARLAMFHTGSKALLVNSTGVVSGQADAMGRVLLGVTGLVDEDFFGEHIATGTYTLQLDPFFVPEPGSLALAAMGAIGAGAAGIRVRRRSRRQSAR